ncbi:glycine cleavage system aminomethyltransferase GcvT [Halobium palmae]|uniref:Probable aminomethyltransferase n=1 Tax=Halobium palmae TaxID=1776492 RepID=A0ABD5RU48_9EURY
MADQKPALYQVHKSSGADFTDFGGWEMPVAFDSISTEHSAVRQSVGVFDVSHMSEVSVSGPDAMQLMEYLTSNSIGELAPGDAQYSCILNNNGIIIDDTVVYRYPTTEGYLFVPNAGHGEQMTDRWRKAATKRELVVDIKNKTQEIGLIAVQGPDAVNTVESVATGEVSSIDRFTCQRSKISNVDCLVARTGYTGEDGFEIFFPVSDSEMIWNAFEDIQSCGLGARNTLRLEAGLLLSGQDFHPRDEPRTPLEAGLEFTVDMTKNEFIGQDVLREQERRGISQRMVGLRIEERAIARHGHPLQHDGTEIGHVTSGTMSPTFNRPLALGYVEESYAKEGTSIEVEIRGKPADATVQNQRFLDVLEPN